MPHIVFDKKIDLQKFAKQFNPIFQKESILIKIMNIFVDADNRMALLPSVVISDIHQQFLIEISTSESKTTLRLYPVTDPEKTDGVKTSLALLAKQIMKLYPEFSITKTNLDDYLGLVMHL